MSIKREKRKKKRERKKKKGRKMERKVDETGLILLKCVRKKKPDLKVNLSLRSISFIDFFLSYL